jgi:hypothetical protein
VTLGWKLVVVFLVFLAILAVVLTVALRERRLGKTIAPGDTRAEQASDARVMAVIFTAIIGGMLLTVLVAWLVFL